VDFFLTSKTWCRTLSQIFKVSMISVDTLKGSPKNEHSVILTLTLYEFLSPDEQKIQYIKDGW